MPEEKDRIPEQVLIDILRVYEFVKKEDTPQDLVCQRDGTFWTTWGDIFKVRKRNKNLGKEITNG